MKILFLLVILANLFVFLWEYRYGQAFAPDTATVLVREDDADLEPIKLVSEKSPSPLSRPATHNTPQ
jgi:hypothetical protein